MKKNLLLLVFLVIGSVDAVRVKIPRADILEKHLCTAGFKNIIEKTDIVKRLVQNPECEDVVVAAIVEFVFADYENELKQQSQSINAQKAAILNSILQNFQAIADLKNLK